MEVTVSNIPPDVTSIEIEICDTTIEGNCVATTAAVAERVAEADVEPGWLTKPTTERLSYTVTATADNLELTAATVDVAFTAEDAGGWQCPRTDYIGTLEIDVPS